MEDTSTPAYPLTIAAPTQDDSGIYGDTQCWVPHGQPTWLVRQRTRMSTGAGPYLSPTPCTLNAQWRAHPP